MGLQSRPLVLGAPALAAIGAPQVPAGADGPFVVLVGAAGALLLFLGLLLARRSQKPKTKKPPRRTFDAGRRVARSRHVRSPEAALRALADAPVGELVQQRPTGRGFEVVLLRKRSQSCAQAAGYLAGLFESAWAREVRIEHADCAGDRGGACRYVVEPLARLSRVAPTAAGAAIRGSGSADRRSPPARPGGG